MPPAGNKYSIIFENENMLVVDKPSGLLSIPDRQQSEVSLKELLQKKYGDIIPVHRLDKDTSGLIVFARNADFHRYLSMLFEQHKVEKYYMGLVGGCPAELSGEIIAPIAEHSTHKGMMTVHRSGKPSHTGYVVQDSNSSFSLILFRLHTGRTHQIRVHAKHIGHPIVCDPLYGDGKPVFLSAFKKGFKLGKFSEDKPIVSRLALHAARLVFDDHGTRREFEAPVPKEFRVLMKQLES